MTITERTLKKWRKEALIEMGKCTVTDPLENIIYSFGDRILRMTQELLDQHLLRSFHENTFKSNSKD